MKFLNHDYDPVISREVGRVTDLLEQLDILSPDLRKKTQLLFANTYGNTLQTTLTKGEQDRFFVITGDIPAMWLRDSTAQVRHYLPLAKTEESLRKVLIGLSLQQTYFILLDPYANAYNLGPTGLCFRVDRTRRHPEVYERKYEVDSLCYPMLLAYLLYTELDEKRHLTNDFYEAMKLVLSQFLKEQRHEELSDYFFERTDCPPSDTLPNEGKGTPVGYTGMTWSGFRPSDDACAYGYHIPSNMFASSVLIYMSTLFAEHYEDHVSARKCRELSREIRRGIEEFGIFEQEGLGRCYAYEVDGLGGKLFMDDANVPSLLSIPYLEYYTGSDPVVQNTRKLILSKANPYYYEGSALQGIGSPHTPPRYVWPIALSMQGLTSEDPDEILSLLSRLAFSDGDTGYMHEGIFVDDPTQFTRPHFAWANSLYSEFIYHAIRVLGGN